MTKSWGRGPIGFTIAKWRIALIPWENRVSLVLGSSGYWVLGALIDSEEELFLIGIPGCVLAIGLHG